ncbi:hypothetical protein Gotur_006395 [Gossypium turneri]
MIHAGFEEGIRAMRPGGKRRIIIPPELGPPVSGTFNVFQLETVRSIRYRITRHTELSKENHSFLFRCCMQLSDWEKS